MAFAAASKRAPMAAAAGLLENLLLAAPPSSSLAPAASVAAGRRLLSSVRGAPAFHHRDIYYYYPAPMIGNDLFFSQHPQLLAPYQFFHTLFTSAAHGYGYAPALVPGRRWWVSKQDEDAVEVKVVMLGMTKEQVKVSANKNGLFVKVKGVVEDEDSGDAQQDPAPYSCLVKLSADEFDLGKARAEMKDGLLKLTVPRVKVDPIDIKVE